MLSAVHKERYEGDVMYGATDTGKMKVVLYTGIGGLEEFSDAMTNKALGFTQIMGDKFVKYNRSVTIVMHSRQSF